jgi:two-component system nitrogen regulation sensor histidine kinase NtrY
MGFRWPVGLAIRLALLMAAVAVFGVLVLQTQFYATSVVAAALVLVLFWELLRYTGAANRELARVIDALGQGELADRPLQLGRHGARMPLAQAFASALDRLRRLSHTAEAERARLTAVVEHAPVPLLSINENGHARLLNRAARRLFDGLVIARREDLVARAPEFAEALSAPPGRRIIRLALPRGSQRCLVAISHGGRGTTIVSLQNIQDELDASEIHAWEDLVKVLAHEIMNSLTPVSSLAQTASLLLGDVRRSPGDAGAAALGELDEAIDTIHRRSTGLMRFVEGYRRFAEPPTPLKRQTPIDQVFERARRLVAAALEEASVTLDMSVEPAGLVLDADPDLVEQALLNLLKNGIEAAQGSAGARVGLAARLDARGRVVLSVADTGPGLPPDLVEQIFVPFFTTKPRGSGIGLPIVRQIMIAHDGSVEAAPGGPGAIFRLTF